MMQQPNEHISLEDLITMFKVYKETFERSASRTSEMEQLYRMVVYAHCYLSIYKESVESMAHIKKLLEAMALNGPHDDMPIRH